MSNIDLELQDNVNTPLDNSRNSDPLLTTPSNSPIKQHFNRMRGYFNILDRVFHYKRMNNVHDQNLNALGSTNLNNNSIVNDANDGVFSNLSAKPESSIDRRQRLTELFHQQLQNQDTNPREHLFNNQADNTGVVSYVSNQDYSNIYNINQLYEQLAGSNPQGSMASGRIDDGEIESNDKPPSYEDAHNDTVPSYWDLSPEGSLYYDEICVNGLPAGSVINFVWNCVVSASFQFFGFLLSYILHTSHAAKEGSRCGLGITFIALGLRTMPNNVSNKVGKGKEIPRYQSLNPTNHDLGAFLKMDTGSLQIIDEESITEEKKNEKDDLINDFKEYMETHYTPDYQISTKTLELKETTAISSRNIENNPMNELLNANKGEFVKADTFESTLSHGSEEKYDHTRNITMMKILAIVLFLSGGLLIIQSIYQYYKVKKTEAKLVMEQERLDDLRERYYQGRSVPVQQADES
ncbi:hypothetical protein ACO0R3_003294 [Hanseniaspora guilliermondii]